MQSTIKYHFLYSYQHRVDLHSLLWAFTRWLVVLVFSQYKFETFVARKKSTYFDAFFSLRFFIRTLIWQILLFTFRNFFVAFYLLLPKNDISIRIALTFTIRSPARTSNSDHPRLRFHVTIDDSIICLIMSDMMFFSVILSDINIYIACWIFFMFEDHLTWCHSHFRLSI